MYSSRGGPLWSKVVRLRLGIVFQYDLCRPCRSRWAIPGRTSKSGRPGLAGRFGIGVAATILLRPEFRDPLVRAVFAM